MAQLTSTVGGDPAEPTPAAPGPADDRSEDDSGNNLVATGALFALLRAWASGVIARVELPDGVPGNQLDVWFGFLGSPYRLTVERVRDPGRVPTDDRWFAMHDHPGFGRHAHHVIAGHPGNWANRTHEGVPVVTWAELQAQR